jgi:hypothetical protein
MYLLHGLSKAVTPVDPKMGIIKDCIGHPPTPNNRHALEHKEASNQSLGQSLLGLFASDL